MARDRETSPPSMDTKRLRRRTALRSMATGLAGATTTQLLGGCGFFFPVPHDGAAQDEPSQGAFITGNGFRPREQWVAEVTIEGIFAGEIGFTIGDTCRTPEGRPAFTIRSYSRAAGVAKVLANAWADARTLVDTATGLPIRSLVDVYDGTRERHYDIDYEEGRYRSLYIRGPENKERRGSHQLPAREVAHDVHSCMALLRRWRPPIDTTGHFYQVVGRKLWRADIRRMPDEEIETSFGKKLATKIDGLATQLSSKNKPTRTQRHFRVWFDNDVPEDGLATPLRVWGETKYAVIQCELAASGDESAPLERDPDVPLAADPAACPEIDEVEG